MTAEVYIVDENGIRMTTKPYLIGPFEIKYNGFVTTYTFVFEFSKFDKDVFNNYHVEQENNEE